MIIPAVIIFLITFMVAFPVYLFTIIRVTHNRPGTARERAIKAMVPAAFFTSIADFTAAIVTYLTDVPSGIITAVLVICLGAIGIAGLMR